MSDPCKPQACAIQDCLKKNGFNESGCTQLIDKLYQCCSKFYLDNGPDVRSPCCPIPRLLQLKMEQREREDLDARLVSKP